jgi:hypothetical protein
VGPWFLRGEAKCLAPFAFGTRAPAGVLLSSVLFVLALVGSAAIGSEQPQSRGRAADYTNLLSGLRATGARVEPGGRIEQPFLSVKGRLIKVDGEEVQVFQYPNARLADTQAARVSRNGRTVGTAKVHWLGPPHFYKREKLLVLYIGQNDQVLNALEAMLGHQFAGD